MQRKGCPPHDGRSCLPLGSASMSSPLHTRPGSGQRRGSICAGLGSSISDQRSCGQPLATSLPISLPTSLPTPPPFPKERHVFIWVSSFSGAPRGRSSWESVLPFQNMEGEDRVRGGSGAPPTRPEITAPSSRSSPPASHSPAAICLSEPLCPLQWASIPSSYTPSRVMHLPTSGPCQGIAEGHGRAQLQCSQTSHGREMPVCLKPERTVEGEVSPDCTQRPVQTLAHTEPDGPGSQG